jgi:hypothetical protein
VHDRSVRVLEAVAQLAGHELVVVRRTRFVAAFERAGDEPRAAGRNERDVRLGFGAPDGGRATSCRPTRCSRSRARSSGPGRAARPGRTWPGW